MIQALKAGLLQTSFASYLPVMEPIILFPFTDLPVELAFMILEYAARPTFDQADLYDARSPYSSALALCRVSKIVRRIVLPELLHTILLPDFRHVEKFVHALRMQKVYKEKGSDLHFDSPAPCTPGPCTKTV